MIQHAQLRERRMPTICGPRYITWNGVRVHKRIIWVICASISLLSARHLLVEQNVHYPLLLYCTQLVFACLMTLRPWLGWRYIQILFRGKSQPWRSMTRRTILITASMLFTSLSTICILEATLHFHNLPTLVMITLIAFFAEDLFLYITRATPHTDFELLHISLLMLASVGLLFTEYRLAVPNLVASIPAMLFAGVARGLWKTVIIHHPDVVMESADQSVLQIITGALVGVVWVTIFGTGDRIFDFGVRNVPLLALNALATALAMMLGKSLLFPMDDEVTDTSSQTIDAPVYRIWDALTLTVLTGIVGCYSTLLMRRSYTNMYQFFCFFLGITCIGSRAIVRISNTRLQKFRNMLSTHELISSSSALSAEYSDTVSLTEEVHRPGMPALVPISQNNMLGKWLLGISIALLWTAYGILDFTERQDRRSPALLDQDYVPQLPLEIVLSMYKEPLDEVGKLVKNLKSMPTLSDAHVTIYIKDSKANNTHVKQQTRADNVTTLPNVGREGETYLNHILNKWDKLAGQTIFLQAGIHNPREFYTHIKKYYNGTTGFLNLGWSGGVCDCENCSDRFSWQDNVHLLPQLHNQIYNSTKCDNILLSYKGQFIVSAARIRGINKDIYSGLSQAFLDKDSWAHQPDFLQGRPDSMSAPDFGYTVERIWNVLFQCSDTDVAWKCPSLVSGWRMGGDISDCQCFDT